MPTFDSTLVEENLDGKYDTMFKQGLQVGKILE